MDCQTKEPGRHCAFCLVFIPPEDGKVKCCGGCKQRAYCSRECQTKDWSPGKESQVHKNWCKRGCGEEDVDWEVAPVEGKGLGLIAKKFIPAEFQIMVDSIRSETHPGVMELPPLNGSFEEKVALNCCMIGEGDSSMCLRIARANHDCHNNADFFKDESFNVGVLYALRDIQAGEEICVNYQPFNDIRFEIDPQSARNVLSSNWGIHCKETCFCRNPEILKLVQKGRKLRSSIIKLGSEGRNAEALEQVEQWIELEPTIGANFESKLQSLEAGFYISIMEEKNLHIARDYMKKLYDIASKILASPKSQVATQFKTILTRTTMFGHLLHKNPELSSLLRQMKLESDQRNSEISAMFQARADMFLFQKALENLDC